MSDPIQARFDAAAARAESWLRGRGLPADGTNISGRFRRKYPLKATFSGQSFALDLLLPKSYPVSPPRLQVSPASQYYGVIPHVEPDGLLCLFNNGTEFNATDVEGVLNETWTRAEKVLGSPDPADFFREIQNYWPDRDAGLASLHLISELPATAATVAAYQARDHSYVGIDAKAIVTWVNNWAKTPGKERKTIAAPILRLPQPLMPAEFPRNIADLLALAAKYDAAVHAAIAAHCAAGMGPGLVVITFPYDGKILAVGVRYPECRLAFQRSIYSGFRKGNVTAQLAISRGRSQLASTQIKRLRTILGTHEQVHSRGGSGHPFQNKTVVLAGCGSLGGYLAHQLAKAGVGKLHLIDPETFGWENAGRHVLGTGGVGGGKSANLAEDLLEQLPHLDITPHAKSWADVWQGTPDVFLKADLVVSTIGHWNEEHDLNVLARRVTGFPAVLFGWIEPHALAGHGLLVHPQLGGCLCCGSSATGDFVQAVCAPETDTMQQGAGCGDFYQPYGVTEMLPSAALIAQLGMDYLRGKVSESELRTWTGPAAVFAEHKVTMREAWSQKLAAAPHGGVHHQPWPVNPKCRYCT